MTLSLAWYPKSEKDTGREFVEVCMRIRPKVGSRLTS
jgi:hypothetical protein